MAMRVSIIRPASTRSYRLWSYQGPAAIAVPAGRRTVQLGTGLGIQASINLSGYSGTRAALLNGPRNLAMHLSEAVQEIGREDIARLRAEQLSGGAGLNLRHKGLQKSFKFKASDRSKVQRINQVFLSEYTRWPAAEAHTKGGVYRAKNGKSMPVPIPGALKRGRFGTFSGKQASFAEAVRRSIESAKSSPSGIFLRIFKNPNTGKVLILREVNHLTKTGKMRKGNRTEVLGVFKRQVRLKKRLDMQGNFDRAAGRHRVIIERHIANAARTIMATK